MAKKEPKEKEESIFECAERAYKKFRKESNEISEAVSQNKKIKMHTFNTKLGQYVVSIIENGKVKYIPVGNYPEVLENIKKI